MISKFFKYVILWFIFVAIMAYSIVTVAYKDYVTAECYKQGWEQGLVTYDFKPYCGTTTNGTNLVAPLDELRNFNESVPPSNGNSS